MALVDYLLQADSCDWGVGLSEWSWLIPPRFKVWFANRFGEPFLVLEDGSIALLRLDAGELLPLVDDHSQFLEALGRDGNAERWLRTSEVDDRIGLGLDLGPGECYGFLIPLALGGYETGANLVVMDVLERIATLGRLHRGLRDLADGEAPSATT
ncbi:MAG: DUF1851 domain-containing protein [Isosphaeraceae bacterium]